MTASLRPASLPRRTQLPLALGEDELAKLTPGERDQVVQQLASLLLEAADVGREADPDDDDV